MDHIQHHHPLKLFDAVHTAQQLGQRIDAVVGEEIFGYHREEGMPGHAFERFHGLFITIWAYVFEFGKVRHSFQNKSLQI